MEEGRRKIERRVKKENRWEEEEGKWGKKVMRIEGEYGDGKKGKEAEVHRAVV